VIRLGSLAGYPFEGPRLLAGWTPSATAAVYAIAYKPDPEAKPDRYAVVYMGHADDLAAERFGMYVLDEFTYPMKWGWIDVADVVATLTARPGYQHVVVTGRDAHPDLIGAADLVVEMTKIKHPMDAGQKGQRGIEW